MTTLPYKNFHFPLNVFVHIILHEEGRVGDLHYGLFEPGETSLLAAQDNSTELLLRHLPPPPARLLEVGFGLGTTLARLSTAGYRTLGIGPDPAQYDMARQRHGHDIELLCSSLEDLGVDRGPFDAVIFQESAQYIEPCTLVECVNRQLGQGGRLIVLDEFRLTPFDPQAEAAPGLPLLRGFFTATEQQGFRLIEELDLSAAAAPTVSWFLARLPEWRQRLLTDLDLAPSQVNELLESGARYLDHYRNGIYGYRLLVLEK